MPCCQEWLRAELWRRPRVRLISRALSGIHLFFVFGLIDRSVNSIPIQVYWIGEERSNGGRIHHGGEQEGWRRWRVHAGGRGSAVGEAVWSAASIWAFFSRRSHRMSSR